jgi:hypothetical protein
LRRFKPYILAISQGYEADDLIRTLQNKQEKKLQSLYGHTGQGFCTGF